MLGAARTDAARNGRWLILLVLFIARAAIAFQFQSIPALSPLLVDNLQIDYALLGTLVGLYMLPGVIFSLPGGVLGQRFGDKQIAVLGLSLMVLGGLWVGLSGTYLSASLGRVVSGVGAVLLNIVLAKMVTDWFAGREIVTAMALFVSSWPVGIGLGLLVLPIVNGTHSEWKRLARASPAFKPTNALAQLGQSEGAPGMRHALPPGSGLLMFLFCSHRPTRIQSSR